MTDDIRPNEPAGSFSRKQQLLFRYTFLVLVDLTVLNLFDQYWDLVFIKSFSISLLAALLLQVLLQVTLAIEHRVVRFFKEKPGTRAKILKGVSIWAVLFGSKLVILEAINTFFGSDVLFGGPIHGLVAFIAVIIAIIVAEQLLFWIYRKLA